MVTTEGNDRPEVFGPVIKKKVDLMKADDGRFSDPAETRLIRLAGTLLARSNALENRIAAIEAATQTCNCAMVVSETVLDLLSQSNGILEKIRLSPDVESRRVLAGYFSKILQQIDSIVLEASYDGKNLALNDSITICTDMTRGSGFLIEGIDMSCEGLGLSPLNPDNLSNPEILERLLKTEQAVNKLKAYAYSYTTVSEMLNTHMAFTRRMIDIFNDGSDRINNSRAGQNAIAHVLSEICGLPSNDDAAPEGGGGRGSGPDLSGREPGERSSKSSGFVTRGYNY